MPPGAWSQWYVVNSDGESQADSYESRRRAQALQLLNNELINRQEAAGLRRFARLRLPGHPDVKRAGISADITAVTPRFP
jgi:hypothetical protein